MKIGQKPNSSSSGNVGIPGGCQGGGGDGQAWNSLIHNYQIKLFIHPHKYFNVLRQMLYFTPEVIRQLLFKSNF